MLTTLTYDEVNCLMSLMVQEAASHLRLEIAELTQKAATSGHGNISDQEAMNAAQEAVLAARISAARLQQDVVKMTAQRDAAWKV